MSRLLIHKPEIRILFGPNTLQLDIMVLLLIERAYNPGTPYNFSCYINQA